MQAYICPSSLVWRQHLEVVSILIHLELQIDNRGSVFAICLRTVLYKIPCPEIEIIISLPLAVSISSVRRSAARMASKVVLQIALLVLFMCHKELQSHQIVSVASDEPPYTEYAKMARYIIHKVGEWIQFKSSKLPKLTQSPRPFTDWTAMGTLSTEKALLGYPMVNVIATADSPKGDNSTGIIFFLLTDLDFTGQDLKVQNKLTAFFSMEQYKQCSDPMEPTCARVMISGRMVKLDEGSPEYSFGNRSMFSRHPNAANWVASK